MRNLKKILALVLAMMMVLSMMVTANAAFVDADDITGKYNEAVEVLSGIGVIDGVKNADDTYNFNPKGILNRAQAAKIISYILTGDLDEIEVLADSVSNPFSDLPSWAEPYVLYAYNEGIVVGRGNGKYDPNGELTGYEFGKMLLIAAGICDNDDFAESWKTVVATELKDARLWSGDDFALSKKLTREEACYLAFNAMKYAPLSEYGYPVLKGKLVIGYYDTLVEAAYATNALNGASGTDYTYGTKKVAGYGKNLLRSVFGVVAGDEYDDFGRPVASSWCYTNGVYIYYELDTPVLTYTTAVTGAQIYSDLKLSASKYQNYTNIYGAVDGVEVADYKTSIKADGQNSILGGQGALTQVFDEGYVDGKYNYLVTTVNTYAGQITDYTAATYNKVGQQTAYPYITITSYSETDPSAAKYGYADYYSEFSKADEPTAVKDGTTILYTKSQYYNAESDTWVQYVVNVAVAESADVTVSSVTGSLISFIADGTTYYANNKYAAKDSTITYVNPVYNPAATNAYTVWFDNFGNVITSKAINAQVNTNYALVVDAKTDTTGWVNGGNASYLVQMVMADGTTETVTTDAASYNLFTATNNGNNKQPMLVKYTITNGKYIFSASDSLETANGDFALKAGNATYTYTTDTNYVANANTLFFIGTTKTVNGQEVVTWKVVKGIANVGSYEDKTGTKTAYLNTNSVTNALVILDGDNGTTAVEAKDIAYLVWNPNALKVTDALGTYKVYTAIINGEVASIKVASDKVDDVFGGSDQSNKLVAGLSSDKGLIVGVVTFDTEALNTIAASAVTKAPASGVIELASGTYGVSADCTVTVLENGNITTGELADVEAGDTVVAQTAYGVITKIYVQKAD